MEVFQFVFFVVMGLFIQNTLYDIKKHVKQSEQYLQWIHEDIQKLGSKEVNQDE